MREAGRRLFELLELKRDDLLINAFPFSPHLAFWMTYFATEAMVVPALHTGGGRILGTHRILEALERLQGTVLTATPSFRLSPARSRMRRARFSRLLLYGRRPPPVGLRVRSRNCCQGGSGEGGRGLHLRFTEGRWPGANAGLPPCPRTRDRVPLSRMEIIDYRPRQRIPPGTRGERRDSHTALTEGQVLLRFRTGDIAKGGLNMSPCPHCGRSLPRLGTDIIRSSYYKEFELTKLKGTLVDLNAFYPLLSGHKDVLEWQLEIRKHNNDPYDLDELYLHITPAEGMSKDFVERSCRNAAEEGRDSATRIAFTAHGLPGASGAGYQEPANAVLLTAGRRAGAVSSLTGAAPQASMDFEDTATPAAYEDGSAGGALPDEG